MNTVVFNYTWNGSVLALVSLRLLRCLYGIQRILNKKSDGLFLGHSRWYRNSWIIRGLLWNLWLMQRVSLTLAQVLQDFLKLKSPDTLMLCFRFRCLWHGTNICCGTCSLCPCDSLVRFGGHIGSWILHFLVNFFTLLMIVYGRDAYVIVNCDLLVHLAVHNVPVISGANSLRGLYRLNMLRFIRWLVRLLLLCLWIWSRIWTVFIAI